MHESFASTRPGHWHSEWTGNHDSVLDTDLDIDAYRLRNDRGWLVFVAYNPLGLVTTPDRVFVLHDTHDTHDIWCLGTPQVNARCGCDTKWWTTTDGIHPEKSNGTRVNDRVCPDCHQELTYWCSVE